MKKILFGTANKEKIRHVRHILSPFSIEIIDPIQLGLKLYVKKYFLLVAQLLAPGTIALLWFIVRLPPFFIVGKWK